MTEEQIDKLIQMRAEGYSYDAIAKSIQVSKPTLLKEAHALEERVKEYRNIYLDSLADKYRIAKAERMNSLNNELQKVEDALGKADYSKVPVFRLQEMKIKLTGLLNADVDSRPEIKRTVRIVVDDGIKDEERNEFMSIFPKFY